MILRVDAQRNKLSQFTSQLVTLPFVNVRLFIFCMGGAGGRRFKFCRPDHFLRPYNYLNIHDICTSRTSDKETIYLFKKIIGIIIF